MHRAPRVSIVLPTFDRPGFLRAAIDSVFAQSCQDWELLIADDGSAAATRDWLRNLGSDRVRVLWLEHTGNPARVRNAALRESRAHYIAFLDSDDVWSPDKLTVQLAALAARKLRWSYTACDRIDARGRHLRSAPLTRATPPGRELVEALLKLEAAIAMPTVVAERALLEEIGGFDESQRFGEFHDLCLRLALRADAAGIDAVLCSVRAHDQHFSADRLAAHADWMRLYGKMQALLPGARQRALARYMRARMALDLARGFARRGDAAATRGALRDGSVMRHWRLWPGATRALLRASSGARP